MKNTDITEVLREQRQEFVSQIKELQDEIKIRETKIEAINVLIGVPTEKQPTKKVEVVDNPPTFPDYPIEGTAFEKIRYVITTRGESTVNQIVDFIVAAEPSLERKKVHKTITLTASRELGNKRLTADKRGQNVNFYSLA